LSLTPHFLIFVCSSQHNSIITLLLSNSRFLLVVVAILTVYITNQGASDPHTRINQEQDGAWPFSADPEYSNVYTNEGAEDPKLHPFKEATQLGLKAAQQGDQASALGYFKLARKLDPTSSEGAMNLGVCLMRSNLLDDALNQVRGPRHDFEGGTTDKAV
jgi:hypothetical protein